MERFFSQLVTKTEGVIKFSYKNKEGIKSEVVPMLSMNNGCFIYCKMKSGIPTGILTIQSDELIIEKIEINGDSANIQQPS